MGREEGEISTGEREGNVEGIHMMSWLGWTAGFQLCTNPGYAFITGLAGYITPGPPLPFSQLARTFAGGLPESQAGFLPRPLSMSGASCARARGIGPRMTES